MPQVSMAENPAMAAELMRSVEEANKPSNRPPDMRTPADTHFELCGGYRQNNGQWTKQFEVRELTGRDEEALGRITDPSRVVIALLERGLVRVGDDKVSPEVIDGVLGGDWETILLAIRTATFGPEVEAVWNCFSCRKEFGTTTDISTVDRKTVEEDELIFLVEGRRGAKYVVEHPYGSTQRKIMAKISAAGPELNSILLADCIQQIDNLPSLGMESILGLPMADRKRIIDALDERRVGPVLKEVKSDCPHCGVEQATPVNVAALFR